MWKRKKENSPIDYQIGTKFTYRKLLLTENLSFMDFISEKKYLIEIGVRENVVALLFEELEYKIWKLRNSIKSTRILLRGNCIPILSKQKKKNSLKNPKPKLNIYEPFSKPHFHTTNTFN